MRIIAVDDEHLALKGIERAISRAIPNCELAVFGAPSKALTHAEQNQIDVAFLDIDMQGMNGLQLAIALKKLHPKVNIIFVTGYSHYAEQAISLRASGFILKPASPEAVETEMENLRHPIDIKTDTGVYVQTFGNFEVFVGGKPLAFQRSKAKELFAYLIDRQGTSVTAAEIAAVLWEDKEYDRSIQSQTQTIISALMKSLRDAEIEDVVIKGRNSLSVDRTKLTCDYYKLLGWETGAVNRYTGEYMASYSWAEMTAGVLSRQVVAAT